MNENTTNRGPGRPKYSPKYPRKLEWTFIDFMGVNDVETNPDSARYGKSTLPKGDKNRCTKLTLTKFLDRDIWIRAESKKKGKKGKRIRLNPRSTVTILEDVFAEPESADGLGRKGFVYCLRERLSERKATKAPKAAKQTRKATRKARTVTAPATRQTDLSPATKQFEAIKEILAAPSPAPTVTPVSVPVATAPAPEPTPAPAVETAPAETPVATESVNTETATPVPTA